MLRLGEELGNALGKLLDDCCTFSPVTDHLGQYKQGCLTAAAVAARVLCLPIHYAGGGSLSDIPRFMQHTAFTRIGIIIIFHPHASDCPHGTT